MRISKADKRLAVIAGAVLLTYSGLRLLSSPMAETIRDLCSITGCIILGFLMFGSFQRASRFPKERMEWYIRGAACIVGCVTLPAAVMALSRTDPGARLFAVWHSGFPFCPLMGFASLVPRYVRRAVHRKQLATIADEQPNRGGTGDVIPATGVAEGAERLSPSPAALAPPTGNGSAESANAKADHLAIRGRK